MSTIDDRTTTFRKWVDSWRLLSPARRVAQGVLWALLVVFAVGVLACLMAVIHTWGLSLASEVVLDVVVAIGVTWMVLHDPPLPRDPSDPTPSPRIAHGVAAVLTLAVVPWICLAGLLGADLSTRPDFYAQIAQIVPVLLLAVLFERRFFTPSAGRSGDERFILRSGFVLLVVGPGLAEVLALLAIASHVQWIEVATTVLAASTIPALLVLIAGPVLVALYEPAPSEPAA